MSAPRALRKRARTSSNAEIARLRDGAFQASGSTGHARTRDEEFWYEDGTVLLVARDVEFRVYRGILADHSPVFSDMFSLPQPPVDSSTSGSAQDLTPTVHLSDSPEDLRHVLRACMPRSGPTRSRFFNTTPSYSYDAISAAVRLGHKYQMSELVDDALAYLKKYYTNSFSPWATTVSYGAPGFPIERAINVVNLARLTNEPGLLLAALMVCCIIDSAETIVRGFEREDGSREELTRADLGVCYAAKTCLVREGVTVWLRVCRSQVADACESGGRCGEVFEEALEELGDYPEVITAPNPFTPCLGAILEEDSLCAACCAMAKERDLYERKAAWDKLPEIFGLELPWPVPDPGDQDFDQSLEAGMA